MAADATQALQIGAAAFAIALTGAMAPGPLLTVAVEQTLRHGKRAAMLLMVGHALLEAALLTGLAFGLHRILVLPAVSTGLSLVGGAFLLWMGGTMLRDAVRGRISLDLKATEAAPGRFGPIVRGAAVSLANPYWVMWWATIGLKLASDSIAIGPLGIAAFFLGHELADFAWYFVIALAVASGRRFISDRVYRWVIGGCAALLVYLAAVFLIAGIRGLGVL
ncbi:MAG: LysE family transporter [Coriobacteriia bacterium]|nr:LysE family transporter [Coriobacteriia bacterium]